MDWNVFTSWMNESELREKFNNFAEAYLKGATADQTLTELFFRLYKLEAVVVNLDKVFKEFRDTYQGPLDSVDEIKKSLEELQKAISVEES